MDRRLRVMMRFANFCLAIMQRLSPSDDESARQDAMLKQDVEQKIRNVVAAIGISKIAAMLIKYVKNPRPLGPSTSRRDTNDHRDNDRALPANDLANDTALYAEYFQQIAGSRPSTATALAARIGRKARDMIRRDRLYRFGPTPVTVTTPEIENDTALTPQVNAPTRPQGSGLVSSARSAAKGQRSVSVPGLPP